MRIKESEQWKDAVHQIAAQSENLKAIETLLHSKLAEPKADLVNVGLEIGLKIEKSLNAIQAIETQIDLLRMNNAEWDSAIDAKLVALFESMKIQGIS